MGKFNITYNESLVYLGLIGIVLGVLLGLIPLILGIKRKNRQYGIFGFLGSTIVGILSPILSVIVVAIFTWLILKKPTVNEPVDVRVVNENPVDIKIDNPEIR